MISSAGVHVVHNALFYTVPKNENLCLSLIIEFQQEEITAKKMHLDINHGATIGLLTETQSALHFRDFLDADSRPTLMLALRSLSQSKQEGSP